jgi:tetratricopeptide (TPR) repeat protein
MEETKIQVNVSIMMDYVEKELSKYDWFFNRIDYYKVYRTLYEAGRLYYIIHKYKESASAFLQALTLKKMDYLPLDNTMIKEYITSCMDGNIDISNDLLQKINNKITYNIDMAEIYEKLGDYYNNNKNFGDAMKYYNKSLEIRKNIKHNGNSTVNLLKKIAKLNIDINYKREASKYYEECAMMLSTNNLLKFGLNRCLLYSLITLLDISTIENLNEKIKEYENKYSIFSNSPEYILFQQLMKAYIDKNSKHIKQVITSNTGDFEQCILQILETICNRMHI